VTAAVELLLCCLGGCELPPSGQSREEGLSPVLLRMRDTYADLQHGPFVSLADFESPDHAKLFRVAGPDGAEFDRRQPSISVLRSRNETGAGGLKARLNGPGHRLVFDGRRSQELALIRDWRDYALLLVSIYGPRDGLTLEFTVRSGTDAPIHWTRTIHAKSGWNLFRFDLAEIGERVDLADVRALIWRAPHIDSPVELFLDDLILANNRRYLLGEPATAGRLYVFELGRAVHVGVRGRFDLAFRDGVIAAWTVDGQGNLTVGTGLGPFPLPVPADWAAQPETPIVYDDPQLFAGWGPAVETAQHVLELSPFRVVVRGHWRFVDEPGGTSTEASADTRPSHTWEYVIYPFGRVCVRVTSLARGAGWGAPRVAYAVALNGRCGFVRVEPEAAYTGATPTEFVLMSQSGHERPDLLWSTHARAASLHRIELASADERRVVVLCGDVAADDTVETAHLLRFWPHDIDGAPEARTFAADYQHSAGLVVSTGAVVTETPGDLNRDGYNESEGCYELAADRGIARFKFDPGGRLRHQPVFRVRQTAGRRCWIYADGQIVETLGRDRAEELCFVIPGVVSAPRTIEVVSRAAPDAEREPAR
jgi:hypothetical protein